MLPFDRFAYVAIVILAAQLVLPDAVAQSPDKPGPEDLERIERQIEAGKKARDTLDQERRALDQKVTALRRDLIRAARTAQEQESVLTRLEAKLPELEADAAARAKALHERRRQMTGTLAALERLSRNPPQALLLSDAEPLNIVRNALLLRSALPHLRARAAALRSDLSGIEEVRVELENRRRDIKTASRRLETERGRLNALMIHKAAERRRMLQQTAAVNDRIATLNRRARSLRELFANLRREKAPPAKPKPSEAARPAPAPPPAIDGPAPDRGGMTLPARGRMIERFGQDTGTGGTSKGATFKTRPRAQVVAPFDGQVVFAGPFKGYGQILIIQHGDAYHTLLAGLRRVDATVGQRLLAGEPIGIMGFQEAGMHLYVEVRHKGEPVNPLPWFTAARDKVRS